MKTIELTIEGMSCGHCVMAVKKALSSLEGVEILDVRIGGATLSVDETRIGERELGKVIADAGYSLAGIG